MALESFLWAILKRSKFIKCFARADESNALQITTVQPIQMKLQAQTAQFREIFTLTALLICASLNQQIREFDFNRNQQLRGSLQ